MKRMSVALLGCAIWLMLAGLAWAESPVLLSHSLNGSSSGAESITFNFTLHVENRGDTPIRELDLSYVPLLVMTREEVNLQVAEIERLGQKDIPFKLITPIAFNEEAILKIPLFWDCKGLDENGNLFNSLTESVTQ